MSNHGEISDGELINRYLNGETALLTTLVKRYHKSFCNKAYWILKDADLAKDIAQDCWTTIIAKLNSLKDADSFRSWAHRIVYTKSIDQIRKINRKRIKQDEYSKDIRKEFDDSEEEEQGLKELLIKSIKQLPGNQQMVIKLFYVEEHSLKEISNLLKISVGTVKSRLFHAREKLKRILKNRNHEK